MYDIVIKAEMFIYRSKTNQIYGYPPAKTVIFSTTKGGGGERWRVQGVRKRFRKAVNINISQLIKGYLYT